MMTVRWCEFWIPCFESPSSILSFFPPAIHATIRIRFMYFLFKLLFFVLNIDSLRRGQIWKKNRGAKYILAVSFFSLDIQLLLFDWTMLFVLAILILVIFILKDFRFLEELMAWGASAPSLRAPFRPFFTSRRLPSDCEPVSDQICENKVNSNLIIISFLPRIRDFSRKVRSGRGGKEIAFFSLKRFNLVLLSQFGSRFVPLVHPKLRQTLYFIFINIAKY